MLRSGIRFNKSHSNVKRCFIQMVNLMFILCICTKLYIYMYNIKHPIDTLDPHIGYIPYVKVLYTNII